MTAPSPSNQQAAVIASMEVTTAALVALYAAANVALLAGYAKIVQETLVSPILHRKATRLASQVVGEVRQRSSALTAQMFTQARSEAKERATSEFSNGRKDIPPKPDAEHPIWDTHASLSVKMIQDDLDGKLATVQDHILRTPDDLYRTIVAKASKSFTADNGITPLQAQAEAYAEFVERGITGYTTTNGRQLPIESYTEMAVRTAGMRAFNEEYQTRLNALGVEYFTVPNDGHPCPACWPWQGRILTNGSSDEIASATIEEATAGGLFHPQCKHVLIPFFPGHSAKPTPSPEWSAEQQAKYDATQRLRALERRVRAQKDVRNHAATLEVKQAAGKRVRATEALIREHVATHSLVRRSHREQPHLGLAPKST